MRAFVGLPLPDAALDVLERVQEGLTVGRHVAADSMHLTLAFLDDQPEQHLQALHQELAEITAPPIQLTFRGLELFGGKLPRVLAAEVEKTPQLNHLCKRVRSACHLAEVALPRARFRPHVTLARFRRQMQPGQVEKIARFLTDASGLALTAQIESFALYQSTLAPDGARYDVLAQYPLTG